MYLRLSITVPQNMEVTLRVPQTYQQTQMYKYVCEHTHTMSGQGLFQDEFRLFGLCSKMT